MESLPKQFVTAMRTLFDIMDDKHTGYVKLTDIENRWRDDRTRGLPRGVIESLQKVTSHEDGLLTFESFCSGLKICLLRNQVDSLNSNVHSRENNQSSGPRTSYTPTADLKNVSREKNWNDFTIGDTNAPLRPINMSQFIPRKDTTIPEGHRNTVKLHKFDHLYGPPKPPRLEKPLITDIKDVCREPKNTQEECVKVFNDEQISENTDCVKKNRGHGDGRPDTDSILNQRKTTRRREPRRHTLHNGIDYNLLKRMKQIEQEKDVLLQGLTAVEEAREWYIKQLAEVQEKMRYAGRMGTYVEPWSEAQQERLELLRARVSELNRQLGALAAGWRRGPLSMHINLALPDPPLADLTTTVVEPNRATVLRAQNRMLVEEVNRKNEKISLLECEKSSLIRELMLQRNRNKLVDNFH